jgi:hypothetical protein
VVSEAPWDGDASPGALADIHIGHCSPFSSNRSEAQSGHNTLIHAGIFAGFFVTSCASCVTLSNMQRQPHGGRTPVFRAQSNLKIIWPVKRKYRSEEEIKSLYKCGEHE